MRIVCARNRIIDISKAEFLADLKKRTANISCRVVLVKLCARYLMSTLRTGH